METQNERQRTPTRNPTQALAIACVICALASLVLFLDIRSDQKQQEQVAQALEAGQAVGGRGMTRTELNYRNNRKPALLATTVLSIIFLGMAVRSRNRAGL